MDGDDATREDLYREAKALGLDVTSKTRKDDLRRVLSEARDGAESDRTDPGGRVAVVICEW